MSEDILAQVREELQPKTMKEGLILLAAEVRGMRELQLKQNGKVDANCNRLTNVETIIKIVGAAAALALTAVGAIIAANWSPEEERCLRYRRS